MHDFLIVLVVVKQKAVAYCCFTGKQWTTKANLMSIDIQLGLHHSHQRFFICYEAKSGSLLLFCTKWSCPLC